MNQGSLFVAGWIAHVVFWALLIIGREELWPRKTVVFVLLWGMGYLLLPMLTNGELWFTPLVAVLDVALLLILLVKGAIG